MDIIQELHHRIHNLDQIIDRIIKEPGNGDEFTEGVKRLLLDVSLNHMAPSNSPHISLKQRQCYEAAIYYVIEPLHPSLFRVTHNMRPDVHKALFEEDKVRAKDISRILQFGKRPLHMDILKYLYSGALDQVHFELEAHEPWHDDVLKALRDWHSEKTVYNWRNVFVADLKNQIRKLLSSTPVLQQMLQMRTKLRAKQEDLASNFLVSCAILIAILGFMGYFSEHSVLLFIISLLIEGVCFLYLFHLSREIIGLSKKQQKLLQEFRV